VLPKTQSSGDVKTPGPPFPVSGKAQGKNIYRKGPAGVKSPSTKASPDSTVSDWGKGKGTRRRGGKMGSEGVGGGGVGGKEGGRKGGGGGRGGKRGGVWEEGGGEGIEEGECRGEREIGWRGRLNGGGEG